MDRILESHEFEWQKLKLCFHKLLTETSSFLQLGIKVTNCKPHHVFVTLQLLHLSQNIAYAKHDFEIAFIRPTARSYLMSLIKKHLYYSITKVVLLF